MDGLTKQLAEALMGLQVEARCGNPDSHGCQTDFDEADAEATRALKAYEKAVHAEQEAQCQS